MIQIKEVYAILHSKFGPQGWWPIKGKYNLDKKELTEKKILEICIGAILTQNTSWKNVEKALKQMNINNVIDIKKLQEIDQKKLCELIKSSGFYNQKAKTLKNFIEHLKKYNNKLKIMFDKSTDDLRKELLELNGIGKETADSIILYAAKKPIFVIDAYTKRIFSRLGLCDQDVKYNELQELFHTKLQLNEQIFNEYNALLVELAKRNCKKTPNCETCCLNKNCKYYLTKN